MSHASHHGEHWCVQNVLLDGTPERPLLKICDFGYSKNEYLDSRPKSLSGTPDYIAPEVPPVAGACRTWASIVCSVPTSASPTHLVEAQSTVKHP